MRFECLGTKTRVNNENVRRPRQICIHSCISDFHARKTEARRNEESEEKLPVTVFAKRVITGNCFRRETTPPEGNGKKVKVPGVYGRWQSILVLLLYPGCMSES